MNLYFVHDDGTIVTPELSGTILEGITRDSIIELTGKLGHEVVERRFSVDEWRDGVSSGRITEVFACGTAAVVTPVGTLRWRGGEVSTGDDEASIGPVTSRARAASRPRCRNHAAVATGPVNSDASAGTSPFAWKSSPNASAMITRKTAVSAFRVRLAISFKYESGD